MKNGFAEILHAAGKKQKILFVAPAQSSHTHSWVELLDNTDFDICIFGIRGTTAPSDYPIKVVSTGTTFMSGRLGNYIRRHTGMICRTFRDNSRRIRMLEILTRLFGRADVWFGEFELELLALTISRWQPHIIHTLGIDPAAHIYLDTRKKFGLEGIGRWVVTAWGGSDFELLRHDPYHIGLIGEVLKECSCFIADNDQAYRYACEHGLDKAKIIPFGRLPGTGGVDVQSLRNMRSSEPSSQRTILYPKAYECEFSKALPVFEAIKSCWDRISPCTIHMTAYNDEALHWYRNLPEYIRSCCHIERRIPREQLLSAMANSRVVLAPTLIDGLPNTLIEAMATGAFPIFSPLESFRDLLENGSNVLFARNLYPDEIAGALVRAMSDDRLVDFAAERNLQLVHQLADRTVIRPQVIEFYLRMCLGGALHEFN